MDRVSFPLGGIGSGMICIDGAGDFTSVSLRHRPNIFFEPILFSAISFQQDGGENHLARVLEGPVPNWKVLQPWGKGVNSSGNGGAGKIFGLPRFQVATFSARFPFAEIALSDPHVPLDVKVTGWSPFIPNDSDNSSLPVAGVEYHFSNPTKKTIEAVYSFHAENFVAAGAPENEQRLMRTKQGFVLERKLQGGFFGRVEDFAARQHRLALVVPPEDRIRIPTAITGCFPRVSLISPCLGKGIHFVSADKEKTGLGGQS